MYLTTPKNRNRLLSLGKAISWRIVGTLATTIISWMLTRQINLAISIGLLEVFSKIILFYLHDRIWEQMRTLKNDKTTESESAGGM